MTTRSNPQKTATGNVRRPKRRIVSVAGPFHGNIITTSARLKVRGAGSTTSLARCKPGSLTITDIGSADFVMLSSIGREAPSWQFQHLFSSFSFWSFLVPSRRGRTPGAGLRTVRHRRGRVLDHSGARADAGFLGAAALASCGRGDEQPHGIMGFFFFVDPRKSWNNSLYLSLFRQGGAAERMFSSLSHDTLFF